MLGVFCVLVLYPVLSIVLLAFHKRSDLVTGFSIPDSLDFGTFKTAWEEGGFDRGLLNSFIVAATVTVVSAVLSTLAGYAFGAMRFRGSDALFYLLLLGLIFPYEATVIPLYYVFRDAGLTDSLWALILPQIGLSVPFGTFWMRAFFRSTPSSLVEASRLDGASSFVTLWRVLLPQAWPAITTMIVLVFMWTWNEFLLALVMIQSDDLRTAPLGLALFAGRQPRHARHHARRRRRGARRAAGRDRLRVPAAELHPRHVRRGGEGMSWVLGRRRRQHEDARGRGGRARGHARRRPRRPVGHLQRRRRRTCAIDAIAAAARQALAAAGIGGDALGAAAFSLAGADWPEDFALLERALRDRLGLPAAPLVVNDAIGALRAGSPDWTGISVVSGTYNAVGARHPDGRVFHLGFWPDGAGGRDLAREGLRAVYHEALGMGPATVLTERAFALFGAPDAIDLLHEFTRRGGLAEAEQDRLAPVVLDAADEGDAVAAAIVAGKGRVLGLQARACAAQLDAPAARARASCSPAACSGIRPSGSPPRRWPSCPARSPSGTARRRSPARCCWRSTGSASPSTRPRSPPASRSTHPKEGAPHGRDRPRRREQGLPRRRRRRRRRRARDRRRRVHGARRARRAAASRRCCG